MLLGECLQIFVSLAKRMILIHIKKIVSNNLRVYWFCSPNFKKAWACSHNGSMNLNAQQACELSISPNHCERPLRACKFCWTIVLTTRPFALVLRWHWAELHNLYTSTSLSENLMCAWRGNVDNESAVSPFEVLTEYSTMIVCFKLLSFWSQRSC